MSSGRRSRARVAALVAKDLRLHGYAVGLFHVGACILFWVVLQTRPETRSGAPQFIISVNFMGGFLFSEWLITREKTKGTFAWLRTLPISATELYVSKVAAVSFYTISLWGLSSLLFLRQLSFPSDWASWFVWQALFLDAALVAVAARWRYSQKLGYVLPILVIGVVGVVGFWITGMVGEPMQLAWQTLSGKLFIATALFAVYGAVGWITWQWVSRSETRKFLE